MVLKKSVHLGGRDAPPFADFPIRHVIAQPKWSAGGTAIVPFCRFSIHGNASVFLIETREKRDQLVGPLAAFALAGSGHELGGEVHVANRVFRECGI